MNNKKKQITKVSVFTISLFIIFFSVTYAFMNQTLSGEKRQVITAGNLSLELQEDENNLTITNAMPMYDEVGMIQEAFTFRLINKVDADANYIVKLEKIIVEQPLDSTIVKYGLMKDEETKIDFVSNIVDDVIDSGTIRGKQIINYSLRLWIDSSVEDVTSIKSKTSSFRLNVEANQAKVVGDPILKKRDTSSSKEMFWNYNADITSIVFENEVNVPSSISLNKKWDVSANEDGSVMAYIEPDSEGSTTYKLHIQGKDKIIANSNSQYLFYNFSKLTSIEGLEYFDTSNVIDMTRMFSGCGALVNLDLRSFDTSNVTNMSSMFSNCSSLSNFDISNFNTSKVTDMSGMFFNCRSLLRLDLQNFDTSQVTDMRSLFQSCSKLQNLNISSFNTSNVTTMEGMFIGLLGMNSLDLSHFDTSSVLIMHHMFAACHNLTSLNLSSFDTSNVTDMHNMFDDCQKLVSLDLSHFHTSNVTNMEAMFSRCSSLTNLDVRNFDTSKVKSMDSMFASCESLTSLNVANFNTTNVEKMSNVFRGCSSLTTLNLSNFTTSNVETLYSIFYGCTSLTSLDIRNFDTTNIPYMGTDNFDSLKTNCNIVVKNASMKTWVQGQNSSLTNISIKSA